MKSSSYSLYFVLFSLIALLLFSLVPIYQILSYDSDRIYNLRAVPAKYRSSLLEYFLDISHKEGAVLFLGDSQVYGHMQPTQYVFSTLLGNKLNKTVINAAFQDAGILDNIYALEYAITKNMEFDVVVFNANPSHVRYPNHKRLDLDNPTDFRFGLLKNSQVFHEFPNKFSPQEVHDGGFAKYYEKPGHFDMPDRGFYIYLTRLNKLIGLAKSISKDVIIYMTPHDGADTIRLELNMSNYDKLSEAADEVCKDNEVVCLNPDISAREHYFDLIHFSEKGHIAMADILLGVIRRGAI